MRAVARISSIGFAAVALLAVASLRAADQQPELIPREVLFGNPDKSGVQFSPDGTQISYLGPLDGVLNVWVAPADDVSQARPVTHDTGRGIRNYFWAYTSHHIVYLQDKGGDENWRAYAVDLAAGETKDLTPLEGVRANVQEVSPNFPEEVLIGLNDRDERFHDIYRVNIVTGQRLPIQLNDGFSGFVTDDDYNVRFAIRMTADGGSEVLRSAGDGWDEFIKIDMEDMLTTSPIGFDKSGQTLFLTDSRDRDTAALNAINLETGELKTLAQDPRSDVTGTLRHPTNKNIQAVAFDYQRVEWQVLDQEIADDLAYLRKVADGELQIVNRTLDDKRWIVAYMDDNGPVRYYDYDHTNQQAKFLFTHRADLEGLPLADMHSTVIKSRDGLNLVSYYTLPVGSSADQANRPAQPLPLVLFVHGGPWGRDNWGYNPYHQWLANRGYAVLSVNFRASTGMGKSFTNAGNREWAGRMHDDLLDAVDWAVKEKIADPGRVCIMGGSYGGYATLVGLTFTPDKFACGVDIVGPSNLVTLLSTIPPYWEPQVELFVTRVGDHRTEAGREFLKSRSPLTFAHRIQKPLLIGQGANDPRVKQAESDQIVTAMQAKQIPVTYVLYPDEGHGFARPANRLSFNAIAEAFLSEHLGGRFEPIGDDFQGSSVTVPTGAEQVPGLGTALKPGS